MSGKTAMTNDSKNLGILLFVGFLYVLPFIIGGHLYVDDFLRIEIPYGWDHNGRYFSTVLSNLIGNGHILILSPFTMMIAALFLIYPAHKISSVFFGSELSFAKASFSLSLLLSPFFINNLAYQYDAILMSASVGMAAMAAYYCYLGVSSKLFYATAFILLILAISSYQSSIAVYLSIILILAIHSMMSGKATIFSAIKFCVIAGVLMLVAYALYKKVIFNPDDMSEYTKMRSEMLGIDMYTLKNMFTSYLKFKEIFYDLFHGFIGKILLLYVTLPFAVILLKKGLSLPVKLTSVVFYLFIIFLSFGMLLILKNPPVTSRSMVSGGVIIMASTMIIFTNITFKRFDWVSVVPMVISFIFVSCFFMLQNINYSRIDNVLMRTNAVLSLQNKDYQKIYLKINKPSSASEPYRKAFPFIYNMNRYFYTGNPFMDKVSHLKLGYSIYPCDSGCKKIESDGTVRFNAQNMILKERNGQAIVIVN